MNDDSKEREQIKALVGLLMQEVAKSHRIVNQYTPTRKIDELAEITCKIADYETRLNRILYPEQFKAFAA